VVEVLGEHAGRENLVDAVVDGRSLVHILALEHIENVSETFAHDHRRRRLQIRDDGRLDKEAGTVRHDFAAENHMAAEGLRFLDGGGERIDGRLIVQGAEQDAGLEGITHSGQ
jgi:hypothetical protein